MTDLFDWEKMYEIHIYNLMEECRAECIAKARAEGIAKGMIEASEYAAVNMIKENYEPSVIHKLTQVSMERINELKASLTGSLQSAAD